MHFHAWRSREGKRQAGNADARAEQAWGRVAHPGSNRVERTLEKREKRCNTSNCLSKSVISLLSMQDGGKKQWRRPRWENLFPVASSTRLNRLCTIRCCAIWK